MEYSLTGSWVRQQQIQQNDDEDACIAIVALALLGRSTQLRTLRTYLTRADLSGHPRIQSAWTHMRSVGNDRAFVTVMGLDVQTFESILVPFATAWDSATIPRADVNPHGEPQPGQRSLDEIGRAHV